MALGRVQSVRIKGFRSVDDWIELRMPPGRPVVLVGENNAGKSNVMRAVDLLLGERWRGNYEPEDHEFFGRDREGRSIQLVADVEDIVTERYGQARDVRNIRWTYEEGTTSYQAITDDGQPGFMSYAIKNQCFCVTLHADRRIRYELSYTNQFTLLSKIMKRFHQHLVSDADRVADLKSHFDDVVDLFRGVEAFGAFEESLRDEVSSLASNLRYPLDVDFSAYDPSNYFHALRIQPRDDDGARTFDELGTGQEQLLALSLLYAYAKAFGGQQGEILLLLEEPESHLHPLAQRWLSRRLRGYVEAGIQVVLTTHSPAFLSLLDVEGLVLVRKSETTGATTLIQLTSEELRDRCVELGAPDQVTPASILPFYETAATEEIKAGFFARAVCLVEGPSEALSLPIFCRRLGFDPDEFGLAIISVSGVGNLAKWYRLFTAYGIPAYVIFDNDTSDDGNGARRTELLTTLGVPQDDHDAVMSTTALEIQDSWAVMGVDFESVLRQYFGDDYTARDAAAQEASPGRAGKPLRARSVAQDLPLEPGHEGADLFRDLVAKLSAHTVV